MTIVAGKVALVTGARIGRATALMFAREGSKVVVSDVNEESCREPWNWWKAGAHVPVDGSFVGQ